MTKNYIIRLIALIFLVLLCQKSYAITFVPSLSVSEEYNDNIYLDADNDDRVEDWITIVSPGFAIEAKTRKTGMLFNYNFSHSSYSNNPENNSFRHNGLIDSWLKLSRHTELGLTNNYTQTEETLTDEESAGGRNSRQLYYTNTTTADIEHAFGEKRSVNISYSYRLLENEDQTVEDNYSHKAMVLLKYNLIKHLDLEEEASYEIGEYEFSPGFIRIKSRTRFTKTISSKFNVFVEYSHTDFKNDTSDDEGVDIWSNTFWSVGSGGEITDFKTEPVYNYESYRVYNPSAGFNWTFEEGSSLSINAGYFVQDRDSEENESGVTIDGNIGKQWRFKKGLISITANSGYDDAQLQSENLGFNIYYQGEIGFEYSFTRTLKCIIGSSYRSDNYVNSGDNETDREDEIYNANLNMSWQAMKWLNTNFAYSYRNRDSNNDSNDYIENKVVLRFTFEPGRW